MRNMGGDEASPARMTDERPDDDFDGSGPVVANRLAQGVIVNATVPATQRSAAVTVGDGAAQAAVRSPAQGDAPGIASATSTKASAAELDVGGYLPDPEAEVSIDECIDIVDRFLGLQIANLGELAAPASSLADEPHLIATAIDRCGGVPPGDGETGQQALQSYQTLIGALVDLQAFVPDDDAMAVRRWDARGRRGGCQSRGRARGSCGPTHPRRTGRRHPVGARRPERDRQPERDPRHRRPHR